MQLLSPRGLVAALVLLGAAGASAQTATVNGIVRDAETGETLVRATVALQGTDRGAATNVEGFYTLGNVPADSVSLRIAYSGYTAQVVRLALAAGETRRLDVQLEPLSLGEAVVTAQQSLADERPPGVTEVSIALVRDIPTVFEADLFRSIQLLPGVKASSDFSSALFIRGGSPDQTLIQLDGTTVYNPTHFFGFFSTFNTDAIKDVQLYKGAYPVEYGGRLGSVLDISSRDGNRNEFAGSATLGLLASRLGVEGPLPGGKGSYMVAGRRSTLEPLLAYLRTTPDSTAIPDGFYFYDVNARVNLDLSPRDRVSLSTYAGQDRVELGFSEDSRFLLNYGNRTASLGYSRIVSGSVFATARATASRYFSYPIGQIGGTEFTQPNTITDYSLRSDVDWTVSPNVELEAGVWGGTLDLGLRSEFNGNVGTDYVQPVGLRLGLPPDAHRARSGLSHHGRPARRVLREPHRRPAGHRAGPPRGLPPLFAAAPGRALVRRVARAPGRGRPLQPVFVAHLQRGVLGLRHLGHDRRRRAAAVGRPARARRQDASGPRLPPRRRAVRAHDATTCSTPAPSSRAWPGWTTRTSSGSARATPTAPSSC